MKKLILTIVLFLMCITLTACYRVDGNSVFYSRMNNQKLEDGMGEIHTDEGKIIIIDLNEKTISDKYGGKPIDAPLVAEGGSTYKKSLSFYNDYNDMEDNLNDLLIKDNPESILYTQAYNIYDSVYGICNIYDKQAGFLFAAGQYVQEEINHSVYYKYDKENDKLETIKKIKKATIVAFSQIFLVYWEDMKYYLYNIETDEIKFLVNDYAFTKNFAKHSHGLIYFNDYYVIFIFNISVKAGFELKSFLYEYENEKLIELTYIQIINENKESKE